MVEIILPIANKVDEMLRLKANVFKCFDKFLSNFWFGYLALKLFIDGIQMTSDISKE